MHNVLVSTVEITTCISFLKLLIQLLYVVQFV